MELRLLTTDTERSTFCYRLEQARVTHGAGFQETSRMRKANRLRLTFSRLYGLFEDEAFEPRRMVAGIAMHDLESFPQSCKEPDLTHLPPRAVLECSDHWSLSRGAGTLAWCGLAVPLRLLEARAVLAYLAADSVHHTRFYAAMGFRKAGAPVEHQYVEGPDGERLRVQPMTLEGAALVRTIEALSGLCTETLANNTVFRLRDRARPSISRLTSTWEKVAGTGANPHSGVVEAPRLNASA